MSMSNGMFYSTQLAEQTTDWSMARNNNQQTPRDDWHYVNHANAEYANNYHDIWYCDNLASSYCINSQ